VAYELHRIEHLAGMSAILFDIEHLAGNLGDAHATCLG